MKSGSPWNLLYVLIKSNYMIPHSAAGDKVIYNTTYSQAALKLVNHL